MRKLQDQVSRRNPDLAARVGREVQSLGTDPRSKLPLLAFPVELAAELFAWLEAQRMTEIATRLRTMAVESPPSPTQRRESMKPLVSPEKALNAILRSAGAKAREPEP